VRATPIDQPLHALPSGADEWFARRRSPDRTPEDDFAFEAWLRADPQNEAAYAECERLWSARQKLAANEDLVRVAFASAGLGTRRPASRAPARRAAGLALALAASVAAIAWMVLPARAPMEPAPIATAKGESRQLALSDGSKVELNTDTVLVANLDPRERRVVLKRGEAFFDVTRDPRRPFVVEVGSTEVRVVGTQFSVRADNGKVEVVVREGVVDVVPEARQSSREAAERVELTHGNRLRYDGGQKLVRVAAVDPERALLWRGGMIEFDETTLEQAVAELNRYSVKPLVIEDDRLRAIRFSGGFRVGDVNAVLFALRERFQVSVEDTGNQLILR
jgi:transmembrane sensor